MDVEEINPRSGIYPLADLEGISVMLHSDVPIAAEHAMWWPGPTLLTWTGAHASAGATMSAPRWVAAIGRVEQVPATDTYYLIADPTGNEARVRVTLLFSDHGAPLSQEFAVPAHSRFNVDVRALYPEAVEKRFGAVLESLAIDGAEPTPVVVEWAVYGDALRITWAAERTAWPRPGRDPDAV